MYKPGLELALRWRYLTAAVGVSTLVLTVGMVAGGWTNFHFFPSVEAPFIAGSITLPQGSPISATSAAVRKLEVGAEHLRAALLEETGQDYFRHIFAAVGDQPMSSRPGGIGPVQNLSAYNVGEVTIELVQSEERAFTSEQLGNRWRELTGPIPEAVDVNFNVSLISPGADIDVMLVGPDMDELRAAADEVKEHLSGYAGVYGITDSFRAGQAGVEARHHADSGDAGIDPSGPWPSGPAGVLRQGGSAHPARA